MPPENPDIELLGVTTVGGNQTLEKVTFNARQVLTIAEVEEKVKTLGTGVADFVVGLFGAFRKNYQNAQGFDDPPLHDPCTIAYLIDPTIVETKKVPADVELTGALTTGMTVADFRAPAPADCHTQVATKLDAPRF